MINFGGKYSRYRMRQRRAFRDWQSRSDDQSFSDVRPPVHKHWRDSNDYREEYFRKNRGLAGKLYFCSQCLRPMINKDKIQVDHIIPPSRFAKRKETPWGISHTSFLARRLNHSFNCVAICPKCNQRKGNKMGKYLLKGLAAKSFETSFKLSQLALAGAFSVALLVTPLPFRLIGYMIRRRRGKNRYAY